ncbi:MAG: UDP-2,3-diacylglucosamine diphosphatase LpxI, partial [Nitrospiraceae bacterium]|nr:UDP-2,3-diacylglucosamine diphosphatase LpxI [Nitrospiraceae bacterium]
MKTVGLLAGMGDLPGIIAEDAKRRGFRVVAIALEPVADPGALEPVADVVERISVGKLGKIFDALKKHGVKEAVMAGKVPKGLIYKNRVTPDMRAIKLLWELKNRNDDTILLALTRELEKEGVKLLETTSFCGEILAPEGVLTRKQKPSKGQRKDIEYGFRMAKEMGRLDVGQTVVVKGMAVMAVEAIEGTDEAIRRGGRLAGG